MVTAQTQPKYEIRVEPLRNDELGIGAVRLMNEGFKGYKSVELDISHLGNNQLIGYSNPYRRGVLERLLRNDVKFLTPALYEEALKSGKLPYARGIYEDLGIVVYSLDGMK